MAEEDPEEARRGVEAAEGHLGPHPGCGREDPHHGEAEELSEDPLAILLAHPSCRGTARS